MLSFICLSVLLGLGYWIRRKLVLLQRLYLPASVIAGLLGLLVLNIFPIPGNWTAGWSKLPGILINIVFACLFLGVEIPGLSKVWKLDFQFLEQAFEVGPIAGFVELVGIVAFSKVWKFIGLGAGFD